MEKSLKNKKILLIIGGGISAYKCLDLIRLLKKELVEIKTILTPSAKNFITPLSIAALSKSKVYDNFFDHKNESEIDHISLSRWCDIILVAPATANTISKFANGTSDDLASTLVLASNKDIVLVPAMNVRMWLNSSTKTNFKKLLSYGYLSIGPTIGEMACGEYGEGKMSSPHEIVHYLKNYFYKRNVLKSKKLKAIVTAGPTREYLDPIRFISNKSSGLQGYEIAKSLNKIGVDTILISGPTKLNITNDVKKINIDTAKEMFAEVKKNLPTDIFIGAAAVGDFGFNTTYKHKIKKEKNDELKILLKKNIDILEFVSNHNSLRPKLVVGFAAETSDLIKNAKNKLLKKHCDWIIANDISYNNFGMESDYNEISLIDKNLNIEKISLNTKSYIAEKIADRIVKVFS
jgi:phosphopantothenoylcysteine decarboxylase/phosphopantothenate--cysteine ligase